MTAEEQNSIIRRIQHIIPQCERLDFWAAVSDSGYSVEFFATVNGKRMQCYDMADNGLIDEDVLNGICFSIAKELRGNPDYRSGESNEFSFQAGIQPL